MVATSRSIKGWIVETFAPLRPVYDAWMKAISGFNWFLARIVLTLIFSTAFLLYGIVLRLIGKDPMRRTLDDRDSYWGKNTLINDDLSEFKRQY